MEQEKKNFEPNNEFDPIPEPLPQFRSSKNGGFSGAKNRFCSDEKPSPVTKMPAFSIGDPYAPEQDPGNTPREPENMRDKNNNAGDFSRTSGGKFIPPEKKKSKTGTVIFLTVMATAMILTGIFFLSVSVTDKNGNGNIVGGNYPDNGSVQVTDEYPDNYGEYYEYWAENTPPSSAESEEKPKLNSNWKGISLKSQPSSKKNYSAQEAYNAVSDATVAVLCFTGKATDTEDASGEGTGMIISSDGYIVTNSHVIGDSKSAYKYQIIDNEGKKYGAKVIGYDTRTDIAVLKINAENLKPVVFGKSEELLIGDDIIAVGNPCGIEFQNTLTKGIVSAKNRSLNDSTVEYIQTDAAVNPGNSGGPLCNLGGQVVGITTAKIDSALYEGMGFAIPSETIKEIADDIIRQGYVSNRARIGIVGVALDSETAETLNVPAGIIVTSVSKDGSLADTSVRSKDIITKIDGQKVTSFNQVYSILAEHRANDKISLTYYRVENDKTGKGFSRTITVTLVADKGETQQ